MPSTATCNKIALSGQTLSSSNGEGSLPVRSLSEISGPLASLSMKATFWLVIAALGNELVGQLAMLVIDERIVEHERAIGHDNDLAVVPRFIVVGFIRDAKNEHVVTRREEAFIVLAQLRLIGFA